MISFTAPVEDILFSLGCLTRNNQLPGFDAAIHADLAAHFAEFSQDVLAPLNRVGDLQGARLEQGRVQMPDGFRKAYAQYCEQGWPGLVIPETYGGQGLGALALGITSEIFAGANHAFEMCTGLMPGAARTLLAFGTSAQKVQYLPKLAAGEWLTTMALTEPNAGSDLSRIQCRGTQTSDGWTLEGEKIFISGGDQDLSEGILHLVLARTSDDGLAGLSLFICLSNRTNGQRNDITVTRIEDKLGIHASPTCQLRFDGADAELLGEEGGGLLAMFTMMNHARLSVALQGVAHAAKATAIARAYAAERIQGQQKRIAEHPDVARMLDEMDLRAIGARGITQLALVELEAGGSKDLIELLTPVAKFFSTEVASEAADLGIQVLGGYGYLEEYGMAQVLRDARICRIYEGTNGIHALALSTRLLKQKRPFEALSRRVTARADMSDIHGQWQSAWQQIQNIPDARALADAFMRLTAELLHQFVWKEMADNAQLHSAPERVTRLAARAASRWDTQLAHFHGQIKLNERTS